MSTKCIDKEKIGLRKRPTISAPETGEERTTSSPRNLRSKSKNNSVKKEQFIEETLTQTQESNEKRSKVSRKNKSGGKSTSKSDPNEWASNKVLEHVLRRTEKSLQMCYEQFCSQEQAQLINRNSIITKETNSSHGTALASIRFVGNKERKIVLTLPNESKEKTGLRNLSVEWDRTNCPTNNNGEASNSKYSNGWGKDKVEFPVFLNSLIAELARQIKLRQFAYYRDFIKALNKVVNQVFKKFPGLPYRTFFVEYEKNLIEKQEVFRQKRLQDIQHMYLYLTDFKIEAEEYPRIPLQPRVYNEITDYKSVFNPTEDPSAHEAYNAKKLMHSDMKGSCKSSCMCCKKKNIQLSDFAEFVPTKSMWACECSDKRDNVECDSNCACGPECNNKLIQSKKGQVLGKDVKIQLCWGLDLFTRYSISQLMPICSTETQFKEDLVNEVIKELNSFENEGWEISLTFQSLHQKYKQLIKEHKANVRQTKKQENGVRVKAADDCELWRLQVIKTVYKTLYKQSRICQVRGLFRVFSKGLGVICSKQGGIPRNSLVVEYFGEVYPTWYWYIKQDAIKSFLAMIRKDKSKRFAQYKQNYNMDFYNIMLEKSHKEPRGREIVVVDPIINGNYASRLSHCCSPNCCTLPVVSNSKYSIALFATKDIAEGEELTFDYCSFTENEKEFQNSVCLCAHAFCNGHYLSYTKKHVGLFDDRVKNFLLDNASFSFLNSNAILLKSAVSVFDERKKEKLKEYSVAENAFKNSPVWLKNWAFYVLEAIIEEKRVLYDELLGSLPNFECANVLTYEMQNHKFEIENLFFQRINNLIITIDKAQHFLSKQDPTRNSPPPIRLMTPIEIVPFLIDGLASIIEELFAQSFPKLVTIIGDLLKALKNRCDEYTSLFSNVDIEIAPVKRSNRFDAKPSRVSKDTLLFHRQSVIDIFKKALTSWNREVGISSSDNLAEKRFLDSLFELAAFDQNNATYRTICKYIYLKMSHTVRDKLSNGSQTPLSDVLYFTAFTINNFTSESYNSFEVNITIRECDLINPRKAFERNTNSNEEKIAHLENPITVITK